MAVIAMRVYQWQKEAKLLRSRDTLRTLRSGSTTDKAGAERAKSGERDGMEKVFSGVKI